MGPSGPPTSCGTCTARSTRGRRRSPTAGSGSVPVTHGSCSASCSGTRTPRTTTGRGPSTARWWARRWSADRYHRDVSPKDLARLEHEAREHPERLQFGPEYEVELEPASHRVEGEWIRDATLGANDGLVSILTLLAGVAGAQVEPSTVLIAG